MLSDLDRYLELCYDFAHGDGLTDEQVIEHESLKIKIESSMRLQELVKERNGIYRNEYEVTKNTTSLNCALLLESLIDESQTTLKEEGKTV